VKWIDGPARPRIRPPRPHPFAFGRRCVLQSPIRSQSSSRSRTTALYEWKRKSDSICIWTEQTEKRFRPYGRPGALGTRDSTVGLLAQGGRTVTRSLYAAWGYSVAPYEPEQGDWKTTPSRRQGAIRATSSLPSSFFAVAGVEATVQHVSIMSPSAAARVPHFCPER
jgi:hypothetical protein